MGRGRTTTAMMIAFLTWTIFEGSSISLPENDTVRLPRSLTLDPSSIDYNQGTFKVLKQINYIFTYIVGHFGSL
jgi:hypothetical protein